MKNMPDKKNHDERLEILMNQLAESVLGLSDAAILAETSEARVDLQREAERTRLVLRQASKVLDSVNKRLSNLGHTINSNDWHRGHSGYHNTCVTCGSFVSFTAATGEMRGEALDGLCPESDAYAIRTREASRR
jgi:hypothetical protein